MLLQDQLEGELVYLTPQKTKRKQGKRDQCLSPIIRMKQHTNNSLSSLGHSSWIWNNLITQPFSGAISSSLASQVLVLNVNVFQTKQIWVFKREEVSHAKTVRFCTDRVAVILQITEWIRQIQTKPLTFVFLRIMRSVLLFRIKNCRCNSIAISPLKILIIFEIWSLGSGFFINKWKETRQFMKALSATFPTPYSKIWLAVGLKGHC